MMIPKSTASTVTAWFLSGIGLAALLAMSSASAQAEPPTSGQATTAPVVVATASAQAQTLPRVTVVSLRPTPSPTPRVAAVQRQAMAPERVKVCGAHEDTLRVLKLTTIEDGVRVHYQFAVSGASTWTNMNRPLLKQLGIRPGGTFCLPHDSNSDMKSAVAADTD